MSDCNIRVMNHEIGGRGPVKALKVVGLVLLGIIGLTLLAIVFGIFVKWLWNALMPEIFDLPEISYWQAVGLAVLAHILFGAHGGPHRYERSRRRNIKKDAQPEKPKQVPSTVKWNRTMLSSGGKRVGNLSNPGCAGKTVTDLKKVNIRGGQAAKPPVRDSFRKDLTRLA